MNLKNKKNIIKSFLVALLSISISCTRDEQSKTDNLDPFSITPRVSRHDVAINSNVNFLPNITSEKTILFKNTEELFSFLNNIIDVGRQHNNKGLTELGHKLTDKFYDKNDHFTHFNSHKTPYAYLFFEEDAEQNSEIITEIKDRSLEYLPLIENVIRNMKINSFPQIENYEDYDPSRYFMEIRNFIGRIDDTLGEKTRIPPDVINAIGATAEEKFIPIIDTLYTEIKTKLLATNTLEQNIENAREILENSFIKDTSVADAMSLKLDMAEGGGEFMDSLPWQQRLKLRLGIIVGTSVSFIQGKNFTSEMMLIEIDKFLAQNLQQVPVFVADVFKKEALKILKNESLFKETTHLVMSRIFDKIIFNDNDRLIPAIEFSNIRTFLDSNNQINFDKSSLSNSQITTASTWALSMSLMLERLRNIKELDGVHNYEYKKILFSLINKSISAPGYIKDEGDTYNGLFLPFDDKAGDTSKIDIRTYYSDENRSYLSMPDSMTIRTGFEIDQNLDVSDIKTSVSSQADYITAMSEILEFLRLDRGWNDFDLSLGTKEVLENSIFPTDKMFLMHLGLVSIPFTNLKKKGVYGYNEKGEARALTVGELETSNNNIYMVSINDVISNGKTNKIVTKDIAKFIIATDKLLRFFDSIDMDNFLAFVGTENIGDQSLQEIFTSDTYEESIALMRQMMLGLGFFLTGKMQFQEGGFYDAYYLDTEFSEPTYSLDTQVSAIKGLLAMHNHKWEGNLIKNVIADTYRTMNRKLFDKDLGFYKINEKQQSMPDLKLTLETIQMLHELDTVLPKEDLNSLRNNRKYWLDRFVEQVSGLD